MPVIAIAGAGFALASGGAAAIGAVVAGTATLATTLSAVAAVGATLGAIGAVTGDKTLGTIGMVMGGIGGVGALAANAGLFGASATTESLFGSTISEVTSTPVNAAFAGQIANDGSLINGATNAMSGFMPGDVTSSVLPDIAQSTAAASGGNITDIIDTLAGVSKPVEMASNALPMESITVTGTRDAAAAGADATAAAPATTLPSPVSTSQITGAPKAPTVMRDGVPDPRVPGNTYSGADGKTYVSDGMRFAAQSSEGGIWNFLKTAGGGSLGMGVLQAGGAFLQGATDELKPAQIEAYKAQAAANNAAAALNQKQVDNMSAPIPVARRVTAAGVTGAPKSLINNQMAGA